MCTDAGIRHRNLNKEVFLTGKRHKDAASGFRIDTPSQRKLAGCYRGPLLGSITRPFRNELVSFNNCIELSWETKTDPRTGISNSAGSIYGLLGSWPGFSGSVDLVP